MTRAHSKQEITTHKLSRAITGFLPKRHRIIEMQSRVSGSRATGSIKIHCSTDRKTFLSDFEAVLNPDGSVKKLWIDGKRVEAEEGSL